VVGLFLPILVGNLVESLRERLRREIMALMPISA